MTSIGDLGHYLSQARHQSELKARVEKAAFEATHGAARNKVEHLGGVSMPLAMLARKQALVETTLTNISGLSGRATAMQAAMGKMHESAEALASRLSIVEQVADPGALSTLSASGEDAFHDVVAALNTELAGQYLFSGAATDSPTTVPSESLLADLRAEVAGQTTAAGVAAAVDAWFDTPGAGYLANGYQGSVSQYFSASIGGSETATFAIRGDDPVLRDLLKATAYAALAADDGVALSAAEQKRLLATARQDLFSTMPELAAERGLHGLMEARLGDAEHSLREEEARLSLLHQDMTHIDQFEAVAAFESAQQQLDILYRVIARRGSVSLAGYLR